MLVEAHAPQNVHSDGISQLCVVTSGASTRSQPPHHPPLPESRAPVATVGAPLPCWHLTTPLFPVVGSVPACLCAPACRALPTCARLSFTHRLISCAAGSHAENERSGAPVGSQTHEAPAGFWLPCCTHCGDNRLRAVNRGYNPCQRAYAFCRKWRAFRCRGRRKEAIRGGSSAGSVGDKALTDLECITEGMDNSALKSEVHAAFLASAYDTAQCATRCSATSTTRGRECAACPVCLLV